MEEMWIEKVVLEGFKSFRDRTELNFNRGHNIIIGNNGAGKSNLLTAISLVLEVRLVSRAERLQLMHPNSASGALVNVVLNNDDHRVPIENENYGEKVVLQRVFTSKTDEIRVNGKISNKKDVSNLLSLAGFSSDNPFNIVQTSDVNVVAMAASSDRLKLVQQLAGFGSFKNQKAKSQHLLNEVTL